MIADDEDIRKVIRWFFEARTTFDVCGEAVTGAGAVEKAETLNPALILLDYSRPEMNGIETGAVLKAMRPEVPAILFTGEDSCPIHTAAITAGIRAGVPKPLIGRLAGLAVSLLD